MRAFAIAVSAACLALAAGAKQREFSFTLDYRDQPLADVARGIPGFGYAADPVPGGEEAVLRCRRAGAWTFRTAKCDDATLAFARSAKIKVVLVLPPDPKKVAADLAHIVRNGFAEAVAGFQLGTDPKGGGADGQAWRSVAQLVARAFPKAPLAVPVRDEKVPMAELLKDGMRSVTHLSFEISDDPAPYERLYNAAVALRKSENPLLRRPRFWAVAPDRLPGAPAADRGTLKTAAWQVQWLMSAYATEKVDAVFFNQPAEANDLGAALRYLGVAFRGHGLVVAHGEMRDAKPKKKSVEISLDLDEENVSIEGEELALAGTPKACRDFAQTGIGDLEYLVLVAGEGQGRGWNDSVCVLFSNTGTEPVRVGVEVKSGKFRNYTRYRIYPDPETGKTVRRALGGYCTPGMPGYVIIPPGDVSAVVFKRYIPQVDG